VSFVNSGPSNRGRNNNITLRGINADSTSNNGGFPVATVAPVSMYIGETPLFLPLRIEDLARVEVLRGPQGTLYGSGSLAGTLRIIPNNPDPSAFFAEVTGDFGRIDSGSDEWNSNYSGVVNLPLNETMALRFSGGYQRWGGFIDMNNLVAFDPPESAVNSPIGIPTAADPDDLNSGFVLLPEQEDANDAIVWNARMAFQWDVTDRLTLNASYFRQEDDVDNVQADFRNFAGGNIDFLAPEDNGFSPNAVGPINYPTGGTDFRASEEYDLPMLLNQPSERHSDLFSLDLELDLGFASLLSTSSWYEDIQNAVVDVSATISVAFPDFYGFLPRLVDKDFTENRLEGFAQEVRLVSQGEGRWDYTVGFFFQNVETDDDTIQYIPGQTFYDSLSLGFHANPQLGDINFITRNATDFEDTAVFGEVTYRITDRWQITGGVRQFWQDFAVDTFSQLPYCGIFCGDNELGDTVVVADASVDDRIYKFNTSFDLNDDTLIYATYAEGFRRGGANGIPLAGPFAASQDLLLYEPDTSENYEIGIKGNLAGQTYSLALYHIDWKNLQVNDASAAGGYDLVANGSEATSDGVELSINGQLLDGLRYSVSYAYIDAEISDSFEVTDNFFGDTAPIISAQEGDPLPNTYEHSYSLSLDYSHALASNWRMRWHLNGYYRDETLSGLVSLIPGDPQPFEIDAFSVWDASINVESGPLQASFYVDNLTDARAVTGGLADARAGARGRYFFVGRPRTIGLRMSYAFGAY